MPAKPVGKPELQVNTRDAKTNLSRYLARVAAGETVVIARAGKPVARLVPAETEPERQPQPRGSILGALAHLGPAELPPSDPRWFFGCLRDAGWVVPEPEHFDRWMEDEIADMFEAAADKLE
jgi:prevent-host-death family protein